MLAPTHLRPSDLLGLSRLAVGGVTGMTELVEAMHAGIARVPSRSPRHTTRGLTGLVYRSVRGVTALVGGSLDAVLGPLVPLFAERPSSASREAVVAALNGVLGDHLEATGNPLAIPMCLRLHGRPLALAAEPLATAIPAPTGKLLVLAHGLCMNDLQWQPTKPDHSDLALGLARDLGYTPLFLHYNSGRHVSTNGRELSALLATLVGCWPVPVSELAIIGHSMGGLVARTWLAGAGAGRVARLVTLASPHHGTALAKLGRGRNARQMRRGSELLSALESAEGDRGPGCPAISVYSLHDTLVAPQDTSRLPWARNVELHGLGHVEIVGAEPVVRLVTEELRAGRALG